MPFEINPAVAGGIAAAVLTPIIVGILGKSKYFQCHNTMTFSDIDTLSIKYEKWVMLSHILFILFTICLAYIWYKILDSMTFHYYLYQKQESIYSIYYIMDFIFIPPIFLGLATSFFPISIILKAILQKNYAEYCYYSDTKYGSGLNSKKVTILLLSSFLGLLIAVFPFFLDNYVLFKNNSIIVDQFGQFDEKIYGYDKIKQLNFYKTVKAPNGNIVEKPNYQIVFEDGFTWSTIDNFRSPKLKYDYELFSFLSNKSEIEIKEYELKIK